MNNYLTYLYLLTPLHTGGSADEGNLMGIAREVHTEFPYLPASSLRGRIRAEMEKEPQADQPNLQAAAKIFFGQKIKDGQQPTEGEVWFSDASLLFFPIASLSHHLVWITCPLWLERWNRWLGSEPAVNQLIQVCREHLSREKNPKSAVVSFSTDTLYLQTALLKTKDLEVHKFDAVKTLLAPLAQNCGLVTQLLNKLIVLTDEDCIALVETGLQREVRVALKEDSKTVDGGSFRSEEAIPPEAVLFFPWGIKPPKKFQPDPEEKNEEKISQAKESKRQQDEAIRQAIAARLDQRLQFGGLEGLGRGWADLKTVQISGSRNI